MWIERRFSRPVTAAGTVRIDRSAALCGAAAIIYVRQHRIIPAGFSGVGWDPGLAGIGGGAVSP